MRAPLQFVVAQQLVGQVQGGRKMGRAELSVRGLGFHRRLNIRVAEPEPHPESLSIASIDMGRLPRSRFKASMRWAASVMADRARRSVAASAGSMRSSGSVLASEWPKSSS